MEYRKKDFINCKYNPMEEAFDTSVVELVPADYTGDPVKLMRYIILMYDPGSKLTRDTSNLEMRKNTAAVLAGYDLGMEEMEDIFELKDELVAEAIDRFLKFEIKERLWYLIQGNEQTFYEYGKRLLQPVKWNDREKDMIAGISLKTKLSEDMAALNDRIENDYRKLYADDESLMKIVTKKKWSPEQQATKIS